MNSDHAQAKADLGLDARQRYADELADYIGTAMQRALTAAQWLQRTQTPVTTRDMRRTLESAREDLREALAELDSFEAAVWPALASGLSEAEQIMRSVEECKPQ